MLTFFMTWAFLDIFHAGEVSKNGSYSRQLIAITNLTNQAQSISGEPSQSALSVGVSVVVRGTGGQRGPTAHLYLISKCALATDSTGDCTRHAGGISFAFARSLGHVRMAGRREGGLLRPRTPQSGRDRVDVTSSSTVHESVSAPVRCGISHTR